MSSQIKARGTSGTARATTGGTTPPRAETPIHRWRAFAVLAVAYFMTIVDLTIVNVALPTIGRKLARLRGQPAVGRDRLRRSPSAASCCSADEQPTCSDDACVLMVWPWRLHTLPRSHAGFATTDGHS